MLDRSRSHLIHLETHPVVDLIVGKRYVILEGIVPGGHAMLARPVTNTHTESRVVPFLELSLSPISASLRSDELLQITNGIIWATLDAHYASISTAAEWVVLVWVKGTRRPLRPKRSFAMICTRVSQRM